MVDMDMYFTIMVDRQSPFAGEVYYRVTEESLTDHLNTKLHEARLQIDKNCRVVTVHGSADEIIPLDDSLEFAKMIPTTSYTL